MSTSSIESSSFWREYTSPEAVRKYTRGTAGWGIRYLLDHDYRSVYRQALNLLPAEVRLRGIRMLEFGCGGGMNLIHLAATLERDGVRVQEAIGCDFSPVLIAAAEAEASAQLADEARRKVRFCVARNERLIGDLTTALSLDRPALEGRFDFVLGVNTVRYAHRAQQQLACAADIHALLAPGGVCTVIDMNDRFPLFRSAVKDRLRGRYRRRVENYLPSLDDYAAPFAATGFEVIRKDNFCWIPHSSGPLLAGMLGSLGTLLSVVAPERAMRSLVVSRKLAISPSRSS